jgi:DNA polymerase-3 subunit chi
MSANCQVDFYILADPRASADRLACHLALKAWEAGHRVMVYSASEDEVRRLDELMWDHPPGRFIPHGTGSDSVDSPVRIAVLDDDIEDGRDLVINMTAQALPQPDRFGRLLEIVPADSARRAASRIKFKTYRDQGLDPAHHEIKKI